MRYLSISSGLWSNVCQLNTNTPMLSFGLNLLFHLRKMRRIGPTLNPQLPSLKHFRGKKIVAVWFLREA